MKKGVTRLVFELGRYVIKIPRIDNGHLNFLQGCLANWKERSYCRMFRNMPEFINLVAPSLFCTWFGLFQIQKRCYVYSKKNCKNQIEEVISIGIKKGWDFKKENLGILNDRWVWLDYGD